jgi:molybdopterin/thiamine biosynthesis adenylyltransferase
MILAGKKIAVLGLGGIANNVAQHLLGLGCRDLRLVDFDKVSITDLHRQLFFCEDDLGRPKAPAMRDRILAIFPEARVEAQEMRIAAMEEVLALVSDCDFVVRSADSPPEIDNWINDACLVRGVPFVVSGTMEQKGLLGPLVVPFETACVQCSETVEFSRLVGDEKRRSVLFYNRVTPVIGMMVGLIGDLLATEVAAYFTNPERCRLTQGFYLLDFITLRWRYLHTQRRAATCPSCGTRENLARYLPS